MSHIRRLNSTRELKMLISDSVISRSFVNTRSLIDRGGITYDVIARQIWALSLQSGSDGTTDLEGYTT